MLIISNQTGQKRYDRNDKFVIAGGILVKDNHSLNSAHNNEIDKHGNYYLTD